jgi:hypothetical protein
LKVVCHESLLEGFAEIAQSALVRKLKFLKYSLSTLQKTVYKSGSLKQSLLLYPNVTKVYFWLWMEGILKTLISSVCVFYNPILTENQSNWREELGIFWRERLSFAEEILKFHNETVSRRSILAYRRYLRHNWMMGHSAESELILALDITDFFIFLQCIHCVGIKFSVKGKNFPVYQIWNKKSKRFGFF